MRDANTADQIWWDNNSAISPEHFERLRQDMLAHAKGMSLYVQDPRRRCRPGERAADAASSPSFAWHSLFIRNLLIRPEREALPSFQPKADDHRPAELQGRSARHGCRSETVIACDLTNGLVLIGGTSYAGEMKKSVFTVPQLPAAQKSVMPMHCSAMSGPPVTQRSSSASRVPARRRSPADPNRTLIVTTSTAGAKRRLQFRGRLPMPRRSACRKRQSPRSLRRTRRFGTVMENVVPDERAFLTSTTFADGEHPLAYPLHFIPNAQQDRARRRSRARSSC